MTNKEKYGDKLIELKCDVGKCSDEVLTTVEHRYNGKLHRRVIKAVYFPYHHCTVEDMGWNMRDGVPDD